MIALICGQKGGTGKSTLATALAVLRQQAGRDVLLVDCDPQGTSLEWAELRAEELDDESRRIPCHALKGKNIHTELKSLRGRYDDIVIDAGGRDSAEMRSAMLAADVLVTPARPSQADAWTLETMDQLVETAQSFNPDLRAHIVFNLVSPNPLMSEHFEAKGFAQGFEHLSLLTLEVDGKNGPVEVPLVVCDRVAHRKAFLEGLAASELEAKDPKGQKAIDNAVGEIKALYKEVFGEAV
jgi:chromosome partitioning protein